jgi:hypothetical protein
MFQWEFGAEKKKCMSLDIKLTERPSLVHKGLDFSFQDRLVTKDESHSCKELHATRRRKIPIVLQTKKGFRNGWLMQLQADTSNRRHKGIFDCVAGLCDVLYWIICR